MAEYCVDVSVFATFHVQAKSARAAKELVIKCADMDCDDPVTLDPSSVDLEVTEVYKRGGNDK